MCCEPVHILIQEVKKKDGDTETLLSLFSFQSNKKPQLRLGMRLFVERLPSTCSLVPYKADGKLNACHLSTWQALGGRIKVQGHA